MGKLITITPLLLFVGVAPFGQYIDRNKLDAHMLAKNSVHR